MLSVVLLMLLLLGSSFKLIVVDVLRSTILPSVVVKPPTCTEYFSVDVIGLFSDDCVVVFFVVDVVVGINSNVLLL
jgi:hypothetical protein